MIEINPTRLRNASKRGSSVVPPVRPLELIQPRSTASIEDSRFEHRLGAMNKPPGHETTETSNNFNQLANGSQSGGDVGVENMVALGRKHPAQ